MQKSTVSPTLAALMAIGFSDKEARTYLASLELGPAPVQAIAAKAGLTRPSVYLMIESLERRGLMTSYKQGKKSLYRASHPLALRYINAQRRAALAKKEQASKALIESLSTIGNGEDGIVVRFLDGQTATPMIQDMALATKTPTSEVVNVKRTRQLAPLYYDKDKRLLIIKKGNYESVVQEYEGYEVNGLPNIRSTKARREILGQIWLVDDHSFFNHKSTNSDKLQITNSAITTTVRTLFKAIRDESCIKKV